MLKLEHRLGDGVEIEVGEPGEEPHHRVVRLRGQCLLGQTQRGLRIVTLEGVVDPLHGL